MVDLGFSWLQQNSVWGGEAGGELARKEAFEIAGMRAEMREALPVPNGALAIVTWRSQPFGRFRLGTAPAGGSRRGRTSRSPLCASYGVGVEATSLPRRAASSATARGS